MARKNVGRLHIGMSANTSGFIRSMRSARASVAQFTGGVGRSIATVKGLAAGLGIAFSGRALQNAIRNQMQLIDSLAKTADRLGIATDKLQQMRSVAGLAGVEVGVFDSAIRRMIRRVAEAAQGAGSAAKALQELGFDAQALAHMSPDEMFLAIGDALNRIPNNADRLRLAFRIFDTGGAKVLNIFNQGSDAIRATMREMERLGDSVTRIDAAKVERANDAITKMQRAIQAAWQEIAVRLAPYIEYTADTLTEWVVNTNKTGEAMDRFIDSVAVAAGWVERLRIAYLGVFGVIEATVGMVTGAIGGIVIAVGTVMQQVAKMASVLPGIGSDISGMLDGIADFTLFEGGIIHSAGLDMWERGLGRIGNAADEMWRKMNDPDGAGGFRDMFQRIEDAAEERARNTGRVLGEGLGTGLEEALEPAVEKAMKVGEFRQGSLLTMALGPLPDAVFTGAPMTEQGPKASQVDMTNDLLEQIRDNIGSMEPSFA